MKFTQSVALALVLAVTATASAGVWSDDFNRPDGPIGGNWSVLAGTWAIESNRGRHTSTPSNEIIQHNLASLAYGSSVTKLDVFQTGTASNFSGVVIGLGGTDTIQVKVQDQVTATAGFSHIGIYHRTSATGWGSWGSATTTLPGGGTSTSGFVAIPAGMEFASGRITVSFPNPDLLQLDIDTDFNGTPDQTYTRNNVLSLAANLGTSHGIIGWQPTSTFDNWNLAPEPAAIGLLAFAGLLLRRRR